MSTWAAAAPRGRERDIVAALVVFGGWVAAGVVAGIVWGLLAPAEHLVVAEPGSVRSIPGESNHYFDSVALFVFIGFAVAVVASVASWRWRSMRGPILFAGMLLGACDGAREMMFVGEWVARLRFPETTASEVGTVIALAPRIDTLTVLIVMPLVACLSVLLMAALDPSDDLRADPHPSVPQQVSAT